MKISTRGRYAVRVLIDLAVHSRGDFLAMREVAERQEISLKYLEQIMPLLVRGNLVETFSGRRGGYRLARQPQDITVGMVLRATEGDFAPVACLDGKICGRAEVCAVLPMWKKFGELAAQFFDGITIGELAQTASFPELSKPQDNTLAEI